MEKRKINKKHSKYYNKSFINSNIRISSRILFYFFLYHIYINNCNIYFIHIYSNFNV